MKRVFILNNLEKKKFPSLSMYLIQWLISYRLNIQKSKFQIKIIAISSDHIGPGSNGNEEVHPSDLQNCSLTIRCSLVSYQGHLFLVWVLPLCRGYSTPVSLQCIRKHLFFLMNIISFLVNALNSVMNIYHIAICKVLIYVRIMFY